MQKKLSIPIYFLLLFLAPPLLSQETKNSSDKEVTKEVQKPQNPVDKEVTKEVQKPQNQVDKEATKEVQKPQNQVDKEATKEVQKPQSSPEKDVNVYKKDEKNIPSLKKGARKHDGFLFRYMIGYAGGSLSHSYPDSIQNINYKDRYSLNGGLAQFFDFGGAVNDYITLHAGLRFLSSEATLQKSSNTNRLESSDVKYSYRTRESSLDFGATFYIMPAMVFFRPTINIASSTSHSITAEKSDGTEIKSLSENLIFPGGQLSGYGLTVGKEWWVTDELALGLALFYQVNNGSYSRHTYSSLYNSVHEEIMKIRSDYYGMLFTITWN